jgi:predicted AlkP superfamily phosphohydrolase/phosphomutase
VSRVVLLGIDGLDPLVVEQHTNELPALGNMRRNGVLAELPSIFPPDSIPAWISIFTGEPPDEHGIIESIDYLAKNPARATEGVPSLLHGRTFWDRLSDEGQRVCVVNPFMAYPAWPVNGVMVTGPVFVDHAEPSTFPERVADEYQLPQLGGIIDFPTHHTMPQFLEASLAVTREQGEFALRLFNELEPDFLFLNVLAIDRIQHFLWRYCDTGDPTYPGPTRLANGIRDAYRAADEIVQRFADVLDSDDVLLVASDHGHGRRPTRMFYVDEFLRRNGLFTPGGVGQSMKTFALEKLKRAGLRTAYRLAQEERAFAFARKLPGRKALKTSSYSLRGGAAARVSRTFGRNSWSGIDLASGLDDATKRSLATELLQLLEDVRDPETGERVVVWACPREEFIDGPRADRYPDVLFELREGYGVDYGVFGGLFGSDTMHRRISGGHRRNGVFASSRPFERTPAGITDLYDVVLGTVVGATA